MKKILMVGGGGREHALAWKCCAGQHPVRLFCAPGNAGTDALGTNLPIAAEQTDELLAWARHERPDLTVVGPEAPLCAGLADAFTAEGLPVFGPSRAAARLEGSKAFAKEIMRAAGVPTARGESFSALEPARAYARKLGAPVVVKADGLAAGKGVTVCETLEAADDALRAALEEERFGSAGQCVLIEECLRGEEASILALVDGEQFVMLASSQDHKRIGEGDTGPNTGGMGAYSPAPRVTAALWPVIRNTVFAPVLAELKRRNITYRGVLYAGLMLTDNGPQVLEFNCRFGDPETQAIVPRWEGDLLPALEACATGSLRADMVRWKPEAAVCVVMAAGGYPGAYAQGAVISGLERAAALPGIQVFHAGTRKQAGQTVTAGGRVLGVTALADTLEDAVQQAYAAVALIDFDGAQCRRDIAWRALQANTKASSPLPGETRRNP